MWDFLSRILWLPFDLMNRMSQRVLLLGRAIYGGIFGAPALKPPPSPAPSPVPKQHSPSPFSTLTNPAVPFDPVDKLTSLQNVLSSSSRQSDFVIDMEKPLASDDSIELSTLSNVCVSEIPELNNTCTLVDEPQRMDQVSEVDKLAAIAEPVANEATATELLTNPHSNAGERAAQHEDDDATADVKKSKRFRETQKRTQQHLSTTKQNEIHGSNQGTSVEEGLPQDDSQIQAKKPKLADDTSLGEDSSADKHKKGKKKRSKKNKKVPAQGSKEGDTMGFSERGPPPNFFIAIQIFNKNIIEKVTQLQQALSDRRIEPAWHNLTSTEIFKDAMVPVAKLHFTLHVMHLKGEGDIEKAQTALAECGQQVHQEFVDEPMDLRIEGLGNFKNNVIFAKIKDTQQIERLTRISELFRKKFTELNIPVDPRPFNPHMTIAKISRSKKLYHKKIRAFPPEMWADHEHTEFGVQRVIGLQLLQMAGEDKTTGYYNCFGQYYFEDPLIINKSPENKL